MEQMAVPGTILGKGFPKGGRVGHAEGDPFAEDSSPQLKYIPKQMNVPRPIEARLNRFASIPPR